MNELPTTGPELIAMGEQLIELGRAMLTNSIVMQMVEPLPPRAPEVINKEEPRLGPDTPRSVGRNGAVTEGIALARARELGRFTQEQFAEATGLKRVATNRWLAILRDHGHIISEDGHFISREGVHPRDWIVKQTEPFSAAELAEACQTEHPLTLLRDFKHQGIVREVDTSGLWAYVPVPLHGPREHETKTPPENIPPNRVDSKATGEPVRVKATQKATRRQRSVAGAGGIKGAKATDRRHDEMMAKRQEREAQRAPKKTQADPRWQAKAARRRAKKTAA